MAMSAASKPFTVKRHSLDVYRVVRAVWLAPARLCLGFYSGPKLG